MAGLVLPPPDFICLWKQRFDPWSCTHFLCYIPLICPSHTCLRTTDLGALSADLGVMFSPHICIYIYFSSMILPMGTPGNFPEGVITLRPSLKVHDFRIVSDKRKMYFQVKIWSAFFPLIQWGSVIYSDLRMWPRTVCPSLTRSQSSLVNKKKTPPSQGLSYPSKTEIKTPHTSAHAPRWYL